MCNLHISPQNAAFYRVISRYNKVTIFPASDSEREKENFAEMEGVGSRLSRTSSRYSGPAATAVFSGRVRKWKKKWVRVSTSSVGVFRASKSNGRNSNNNNNSSNSPHHLLLHKWTPLSSATVTSSDANGSGETEEPPKRRFRYAPVSFSPKLEIYLGFFLGGIISSGMIPL